MSDNPNADRRPDGNTAGLPVLSDARVDEMEEALFADITRERTRRGVRRNRGLLAGGAAAAVIVVAAVIAPSVGTLVTGSSGGGAYDESAVAPGQGVAEPTTTEGKAIAESLTGEDSAGGAADLAPGAADGGASRDIITTASATVVVDDVTAAAAAVADAAENRDGYVESLSVGQSGQAVPLDPEGGVVYDTSMPYPYTPDGAWITVRVPADQLTALVDELSTVGEVTASSENRQDVTEVTLDLQARVDAAQASVDRLMQLMQQAGNLTDLIAAESALAERQATLESYQQQLEYYDGQVAMSTLTVTLTPDVEPISADPAGFGDGLAAGWNGLVATLNGIVIAIGFLIPWLLVLAAAGLIVWGIVALVRRSRRNTRTTSRVNASPDRDPETSND